MPTRKTVASRSDDNVLSMYLAEINRVPLLSREEEKDLATRARDGDEAAKEHLARANLRFVVNVAKRYQNQGLPLSDLVSEGNIGLIKAAERFDPARECRFSTLCAIWVRQSIRRALANLGRTVRLPVYLADRIRKMGEAEFDLNKKLRRLPTDEELANTTGIPAEKIQLMKILLKK